jgi:hypothetical protein
MGSTTECESFDGTGREETASSSKEKGSKSLFKRLLNLILALGLKIFLDDRGAAWGWARLNARYQPISLRSDEFAALCQTAYFAEYDDAISDGVINKVAVFLKHTATQRYPLHNRFAHRADELWVDLGTDTGEVVVITGDGWARVCPMAPVFRRFSHQKTLPLPDRSGSFHDMVNYLPMTRFDDQALVLVWICSLFLEHIQRPPLLLYGPQGSGKSTCSEIIRQIVDPSCTPTLSLPQNRAELIQILDHHALPVFDNIERLPRWASPEICRAVTGGGFSKRTLYSDDSDSIFRFRRPIILNGINLPANAPDLLDRSVIVKLDRLSDEERGAAGGRSELTAQFRAARPRLFGGILNVLSDAMRIRPSVKLEKLHRMDEFTLWGCAIAKALGVGQQTFLDSYHANISRHHEELVAQDPVCLAAIQFMSSRLSWQGAPSKLYSELATIAKAEGYDKEASWPKAPNALTRRMNELRESLAAVGVAVSQPRTKSQRSVILTCVKSDWLSEISSSSSSEPIGAQSKGAADDDNDDGAPVSAVHTSSPATHQNDEIMSV